MAYSLAMPASALAEHCTRCGACYLFIYYIMQIYSYLVQSLRDILRIYCRGRRYEETVGSSSREYNHNNSISRRKSKSYNYISYYRTSIHLRYPEANASADHAVTAPQPAILCAQPLSPGAVIHGRAAFPSASSLRLRLGVHGMTP
jgi:hypothetical protein